LLLTPQVLSNQEKGLCLFAPALVVLLQTDSLDSRSTNDAAIRQANARNHAQLEANLTDERVE
jgi:hypothetical protein